MPQTKFNTLEKLALKKFSSDAIHLKYIEFVYNWSKLYLSSENVTERVH